MPTMEDYEQVQANYGNPQKRASHQCETKNKTRAKIGRSTTKPWLKDQEQNHGKPKTIASSITN